MPVAVTASASVRILRPAVIDIASEAGEAEGREGDRTGRQRRTDQAGTLWIEFT